MSANPDPLASTASQPRADGERPVLRPDTAARYRVIRAHARGGLGEVLLAVDEELNREVALKHVREDVTDDDALRRFVREAEVTGSLEHPGVVPIYGLGLGADGRPVYAMRFIRGESLQTALASLHGPNRPKSAHERQLVLRRLVTRFVAVCNAVAFAHSRGIVHRDLKPPNIMLGPFGETLVVDWGLAKIMSEGPAATTSTGKSLSESSQTQTGAVLGTPAYMAPEQASGTADVGPAADVYGLGGILYAILTGKPPALGGNLMSVLKKVSTGEVTPPAKHNSEAPPALAAVCRRALALQPEQRYASALDLAADVDRWLADEPVSAYREPLLTRLARASRRHLVAVVVVGSFLLLTLMFLPPILALIHTLKDAERKAIEAAARERAAKRLQEPGNAPLFPPEQPGLDIRFGMVVFPAVSPFGMPPNVEQELPDWNNYLLVPDGQQDAVIEATTRRLTADPMDGEAYLARGLAHCMRRDFVGARADLDQAVELLGSAEALAARGGLGLIDDDLAGACVDLAAALRVDPRCVEALFYRAQLHRWQNDLEHALIDCSRAIRLRPNRAAFYALRAELHLERNDQQSAQEDQSLAERLSGEGGRP